MTDTPSDVAPALRASEAFRSLQRDFGVATGLPLELLNPYGGTGPLDCRHAPRPRTPLCAYLQADAGGTCAVCRETRRGVLRGGPEQATTVECPAGLTETVIPIRVGRDVVGFLQTGQVLLHAPTVAGFERMVRWLARRRIPHDRERLRALYFGAPRVSRRRYTALLGLLQHGAAALAGAAEQARRAQEREFSPGVARACAFIREHLDDGLDLASVARAAGLSRHHFCKVFRRETGLKFTAYVGRARVERACVLLARPYARVAEVALEAGFQSISQFNRAFRQVHGKSPSEYRLGLPAGALHRERESGGVAA